MFLKGRFLIGDGHVQRNGFLPLAEENNIVMMFPQVKNFSSNNTIRLEVQVKPSWEWPLNPDGCWDHWGYLGENDVTDNYQFATKYGLQMGGVARMIERVANIKMLPFSK